MGGEVGSGAVGDGGLGRVVAVVLNMGLAHEVMQIVRGGIRRRQTEQERRSSRKFSGEDMDTCEKDEASSQ